MSKKIVLREAKKASELKTPRNEWHFHIQQTTRGSVTRNKKKIIPRKRKYKEKLND